MRFYFPEMADAIDLKKEDTRISGIKFDAAPLVRTAKQVTVAAPEPQLSPSGATLEKAEDLYLKRKLEEAEQLYTRSLQQKGSAEEHAQAYYGLARISVLQNKPQDAVTLFEKTLTASPDAQTKAWTLVYLARLAKAASDPERAAKFYQEALGVQGASEQALKAARTESKNIPN
jgi:tetratricopeptide (TPR) repeat protein